MRPPDLRLGHARRRSASALISCNSVVTVDKSPETYIPDYKADKPKFNLGNTGPIHIHDIVKNFDKKISCDLDGLSLKLLKTVSINISKPLAHIFNLSLDNGIFPEKLKISRIVPVYKSGDPKSCDNYRPIALVNTLSKILEKIVSISLTNHLQINNLLYSVQASIINMASNEINLRNTI